jgi:hypothetical protein
MVGLAIDGGSGAIGVASITAPNLGTEIGRADVATGGRARGDEWTYCEAFET